LRFKDYMYKWLVTVLALQGVYFKFREDRGDAYLRRGGT